MRYGAWCAYQNPDNSEMNYFYSFRLVVRFGGLPLVPLVAEFVPAARQAGGGRES